MHSERVSRLSERHGTAQGKAPSAGDPACWAERLRTRARDVIVVGTAPPAYAITDLLRAYGLSVGSWLLPNTPSPERLARAVRGLARSTAGWETAVALVSCWADPAVAAVVDPAALAAAPRPARWLDLTPGTPHHARAALRAPLGMAAYTARCWIPTGSRHTLRRAALAPDLPRTYVEVLWALATLPPRF
ncbi:hypothetical protein K7472_25675 [Streptomyces sp. PTM05]|uniref:Uncharacterized protein n=1 Tax=Streptantibioticus parmotrematis TaxID=2873249 RepID=A0ABS7QYA7_9ACTN|nr:hypothetical protein [Streptantibioticus parmotrematis]MBY8888202.1 hypothetical protein [Streptantibioticus parmotrematis]